jgi:phosphonopyruvate decarboxylase
MMNCSFFYNCLVERGFDFFTGVPDSLLKDFCAYVTDNTDSNRHIIAANEGGAIALACGHYLATGKPGLVYMQNSGQGNATNPLVSLADADVYSIPVLLLIGWRGQPGIKDEPQHIKQGKITLSLLDTLNIPYRLLPQTNDMAAQCLDEIAALIKSTQAPVALVVIEGTFESYKSQIVTTSHYQLERETAINIVVENLAPSDIIVSTTGKISRELYEYRDAAGKDHSRDFLTVGSMGHASQIALGIALARPHRQVYILDGDGAAIMHMGSFTIIGSQKPENIKHIILNNGCHDSVGGQPSAGFKINFVEIAKGCGYKVALQADNPGEVHEKIKMLSSSQGPALLEIKVKKGARADLGRPKSSPKENKTGFMRFLAN